MTYWYPTVRNMHEAVWIKRHIEALATQVSGQYVFHFEIRRDRKFTFHRDAAHDNYTSFRFSGPMPWWVIEILSSVGTFCLLIFKARHYDIINIHIAYPLLTYFHWMKRWVTKPVVITEHWSGYHFNFGVKKELPRVQRIFRNDLPLITVSESLLKDIKKFSRVSPLKTRVIYNGIDTGTFRRREDIKVESHVLFMASQWKWPKLPHVVIQAFASLIQLQPFAHYRLRVGGSGPQFNALGELVTSLKLEKSVALLGNLASDEISKEMNACAAFLHCSEYETFSVVCAEAVCCGTPVIASAVGGIPEFIDASNGILIRENTVPAWLSALKDLDHSHFDRTAISRSAGARFAAGKVGLRYADFLKEVLSADQ